LLAIGLWFLFLHSERLESLWYPHGVSESKRQASLQTYLHASSFAMP
jgi:hypothetical protein